MFLLVPSESFWYLRVRQGLRELTCLRIEPAHMFAPIQRKLRSQCGVGLLGAIESFARLILCEGDLLVIL